MNFLKQKNKKNNGHKTLSLSKGLTLIETMIAISVFTLSVLALLVSLGGSISNTNAVQRKMIATYLAQEGVEYMRNMRDTYVLYDAGGAQTGWDSFNNNLVDSSDCQGANGCFFDADNLNYNNPTQPMLDINPTACSSSTCANGALSYNSTTGKYGFSGSSSGFSRSIVLTEPSANETKVSSTVFWTQASVLERVSFSESFYNWIE